MAVGCRSSKHKGHTHVVSSLPFIPSPPRLFSVLPSIFIFIFINSILDKFQSNNNLFIYDIVNIFHISKSYIYKIIL